MKIFKSILLTVLVALLLIIPLANAKEKVKVYIFEAGGCPYCEAEVEYLEGLPSYGEKFEIVRKELYVDHVDWVEGADYELGKKTADLFLEAGFTDASVSGTPFVVISNLYAAATYSTDLESIIDEAYEKGDADVVGCIAEGKDNCMPASPTNGSEIVATVITILVIAGLVYLIVVTRKNSSYDGEYQYNSEIIEDIDEDDYVDESHDDEDDDDEEEDEKPTKAAKKVVTVKTVEKTRVRKVSKSNKRKKQ